MTEEVLKDDQSLIMKVILMFLAPGANTASMVLLNITMVMVWILIALSLYYKYYNIHVYIIGILTTLLVIFVNGYAVFEKCLSFSFSAVINSTIASAEEENEEEDEDEDDMKSNKDKQD